MICYHATCFLCQASAERTPTMPAAFLGLGLLFMGCSRWQNWQVLSLHAAGLRVHVHARLALPQVVQSRARRARLRALWQPAVQRGAQQGGAGRGAPTGTFPSAHSWPAAPAAPIPERSGSLPRDPVSSEAAAGAEERLRPAWRERALHPEPEPLSSETSADTSEGPWPHSGSGSAGAPAAAFPACTRAHPCGCRHCRSSWCSGWSCRWPRDKQR
ncbi:unnamed protein product, partial [Prorocentrum cordatum]